MRIEKNTRNFWLGNLFVEISKISVGYISVMMMEVFNGGELLKMFWKGFLDFFLERRGWALRIFSNIFVEVLVKKLATIRKMVSMDIGPFILENIDGRISWLMINVWWMFFYAFMFRLFFESVSFIVSNEYALFCDFYFKRKDREEMALLHIFAMVIQYTEDILEIFYFRGKKLEKRGRIGEAEWYFIRWKVSQSRHK